MSQSSSSEADDGDTQFVDNLAQHELGFWFAAIFWYGLGDSVSTLVGLQYADVAEIGPVAGPVMESFGTGGLIGIKLLFFAVTGTAWYLLTRPTRVAIPIAITIVGTAVTVWNVFVIYLAQ